MSRRPAGRFAGAPGSLTATAGDAQVTLSWPAASGASSYNVKSATNSGGPYTIFTNVTTTACTNTGLSNGTTYFYVVSALNIAGESTNSVQASATPQAPPPNLIISPPARISCSPGRWRPRVSHCSQPRISRPEIG